MILLRPDCLVFETSAGELIPCSATQVSVELIGEAAGLLDQETIENAATGVLHYFKKELGRTSVSMAEFSQALEQALANLGFKIKSAPLQPAPAAIVESDLLRLAFQSGNACELVFFSSLRQELRRQLELGPHVVRFRGLRICVKQLTGAKRWSPRCQTLNDQIVHYLRTCLRAENRGQSCALLVS